MTCHKEKELHATGNLNIMSVLYLDLCKSDLIFEESLKNKNKDSEEEHGANLWNDVCVMMVSDSLLGMCFGPNHSHGF